MIVISAWPSLSSVDGDRAEPQHTIYGAEWTDARRRIRDVAPESRALFTNTLDHIESGWEHVRELQHWCEENREYAITHTDDFADLLHFVDADLVDIFRVVAAEVAALVPGYPEWAEQADADNVEGDIDVFRRYFAVFALAIEHEPRAEPLREATRTAAKGLAGWCTELGNLVAGIVAVCDL